MLDDLLPLLQAVPPAGPRADAQRRCPPRWRAAASSLGENATLVDDYFTELNPRHADRSRPTSPALADVVVALRRRRARPAADPARRRASPAATDRREAGRAGVVPRRHQPGSPRRPNQVLTENEARIIRLGEVSRPTLEVLAKYSPNYPCFAEGLVEWKPRIRRSVRGRRSCTSPSRSCRSAAVRAGRGAAFEDDRMPGLLRPAEPAGPAGPTPARSTTTAATAAANRYVFSGVPTAFDGPTTRPGRVTPSRAAASSAALVGPQLGLEPDRGTRHRDTAVGPGRPRHGGEPVSAAACQQVAADRLVAGQAAASSSSSRSRPSRCSPRRSPTSRFGDKSDYAAVFTDVTGLIAGDDVRIAGVRVGRGHRHRGGWRLGRGAQPGRRPVHRRPHGGADRGHDRADPLPQPDRPALPLAGAGAGRRRASCRSARRSRSSGRSPPWTSPRCSTGSSRCSPP